MKELISLILNDLAALCGYIYLLILIIMQVFYPEDFYSIPTNELIFFTILAAIVILDKSSKI